jgi:polyhydroxybutyrate depolymerase
MNSISDSIGFAVIYPQGINNGWNTLSGFPGGSQADDVGFISALRAKYTIDLQADTSRVYACGFSAGGYMSYLLKCSLPGAFRAVASVAGTMSAGVVDVCSGGPSVPFLHIHGTSDAVVSYRGSIFSGIGVDELIELGIQSNACDTIAQVQAYPDIDANDGSAAELYRYDQCDFGDRVHLIRISGGGHTWPGITTPGFGVGSVNMDLSASHEIWRFFESQVSPSVLSDELNTSVRFFPNPVKEMLNIEGEGLPVDWCIYNVNGQQQATELVDTDWGYELNTSMLPSGVYFLRTSTGLIGCRFIKQE